MEEQKEDDEFPSNWRTIHTRGECLRIELDGNSNRSLEDVAKYILKVKKRISTSIFYFMIDYPKLNDSVIYAITEVILQTKSKLKAFGIFKKFGEIYLRFDWTDISCKAWSRLGYVLRQCKYLDCIRFADGLIGNHKFLSLILELGERSNDLIYGDIGLNGWFKSYLSGGKAETIKILFTLLSIEHVPRLGIVSPLRKLSRDIIRLLSTYIL